jgi:chaperonin cofactor prefoldin
MDAESKSLIRQLKHKLEDVQSSEKVCQRAKHAAETELTELTSTLEDVRAKNHEILEMYGEVV